jgi:hypothetical protein
VRTLPLIPHADEAIRKWFPSEFTWRLYVVLQVPALIAFAFITIALIGAGDLFRYHSIYELADLEIATAECVSRRGTIFDRYDPEEEPDPAKRLQACVEREMAPRVVKEEIVGIRAAGVRDLLIFLVLAFVMPLAAVRVPTWLWEGWRQGRS